MQINRKFYKSMLHNCRCLFFALITIILNSCICSENIDTVKEIDPVNHAYMLIINLISDANQIDVHADNFIFRDIIHYNTNDYQYHKIQFGNVNLRVYNNSDNSLLFGSYSNFSKDSVYTLLVFGTENNSSVALVPDEINFLNNKDSSTKVRFFNFSKRFKEVNVAYYDSKKIDTNKSITFQSGTSYLEKKFGLDSIIVSRAVGGDSILLRVSDYILENKGLNNFILYDDEISSKPAIMLVKAERGN
ncbi:MAG: DUF4397 domain-containing protein [Candidatus Kapabacteria bacterium]|nr:DUF4397 domain-containing protein [Candidatus Kapabacteria bacterium]